MNKKILIGVGVVVLVFVVFILVKKNNSELTNNAESQNTEIAGDVGTVPQGKLVTGTDKETFSGTITAVDTGCFSDKVCSVTVDDKKVVLVKGGRGQPSDTIVGKLLGVNSIDELQQKIGQHANVFATTTPDGAYSIYGNSKYYVEVLDLKK